MKIVIWGVCAALLAGCAAGTDQTPSGSPNVAIIQEAAALAEASNASERQRELLRNAEDNGEVTFAMSEEATESMLSCVEAVGFQVSDKHVSDEYGAPTLLFYLQAPEGIEDTAADLLYDDCEDVHRRWVQYAYENQPAARDAFDSQIEEAREELLACLRDRGSRLPDDATTDEIVAEDVRMGSEALERGDQTWTDCAYLSGISY